MRIHSESIFYKIAGIFNSNRTLSFQSNNKTSAVSGGTSMHTYSAGGHQTGVTTQVGFQIDSLRYDWMPNDINTAIWKPCQANC